MPFELTARPARHAARRVRHLRPVDRAGRRPRRLLGAHRVRRRDRQGLAQFADAPGGPGGRASASSSTRSPSRASSTPRSSRASSCCATSSLASRNAAGGVAALGGLTIFFTYGGVDATGQNPNWKTFGYPGPVSLPPREPKEIVPLVPEDDTTLEADVVVVGSGAGGGVIAGRLAGQGLKVVVLEAGGHFDESDFNQVELWAYQHLYYRGGPTPTADQNISLQAGSRLGGGTVINWTNSPAHQAVGARAVGARARPRPTSATDAFDAHLDAVCERLGGQRRLLGPQPRPAAHAARRRGARAGRSSRRTATPIPRPMTRRAPATSASATSRAPSSRRPEDLPRRRGA